MRAKQLMVGFVAVLGMLLAPSTAGASEHPERVPAEVDAGQKQPPPEPQGFNPQGEFGPASNHPGSGYWMVDVSGAVYGFGSARYFGGPNQRYPYPNCDDVDYLGYCDFIIDIEGTPRVSGGPSANGYWALDTMGFVWPFGDARDLGDLDTYRWDPWMSITSTADGRGLWGFSYQGCVETLGDAQRYGDMCAERLNAPVVGSAVTPSGRGYYLVAEDGGIFSYGDAKFYGSTGNMTLNQPVTDMVVTPTGKGYWLVALDGGIFAFGDAKFYGSMGAVPLNKPVSGMVASPTGKGYLMVAEDGGIFTFGDVPFHGSLGDRPPHWPIVAVAVR